MSTYIWQWVCSKETFHSSRVIYNGQQNKTYPKGCQAIHQAAEVVGALDRPSPAAEEEEEEVHRQVAEEVEEVRPCPEEEVAEVALQRASEEEVVEEEEEEVCWCQA